MPYSNAVYNLIPTAPETLCARIYTSLRTLGLFVGGDFSKSSSSGILLFLMSSGNSQAIMISDTKDIERRKGRWIYTLSNEMEI